MHGVISQASEITIININYFLSLLSNTIFRINAQKRYDYETRNYFICSILAIHYHHLPGYYYLHLFWITYVTLLAETERSSLGPTEINILTELVRTFITVNQHCRLSYDHCRLRPVHMDGTFRFKCNQNGECIDRFFLYVQPHTGDFPVAINKVFKSRVHG